MIHPKALKTFGLSVLVLLALMSATAVTAQAETEFKINGSPLKADESLTGSTPSTWLFYIAKNVIMHCKKQLYIGFVVLFLTRKVDDLYKYEECVTLIESKEVSSCNVSEFSLNTEASFFLHEGATYMLVGGKEGAETLGTIKFGKECSLGSELKVTGSYVMECSKVSCETEAVAHTFATALPELFGDTLKIGGQAARMEGTETIELGGVNKGQKWSVIG